MREIKKEDKMSQRLCVGSTTDTFYDCVIDKKTNIFEVKDTLLEDWLCYHEGLFLDPLKVRINDRNLYYRIESTIKTVLTIIGLNYPSDIWMFYTDNTCIEHPTKAELYTWMKNEARK